MEIRTARSGRSLTAPTTLGSFVLRCSTLVWLMRWSKFDTIRLIIDIELPFFDFLEYISRYHKSDEAYNMLRIICSIYLVNFFSSIYESFFNASGSFSTSFHENQAVFSSKCFPLFSFHFTTTVNLF